jgi:HD-GYP domain-containing protein (c-di-GMP phosphodiesterase class II)
VFESKQVQGTMLEDLVAALSSALDVTVPGLAGHHRRMSYISLRLGLTLRLPASRLRRVLLAASLHDVGVILAAPRLGERPTSAERDRYARAGAEFLRSSDALGEIAEVIEHHQRPYRRGLDEAPLESRIVALADAVDRAIVPDVPILAQRERIDRELGAAAGPELDPVLVVAFRDLARAEGFWLELVSEDLDASVAEMTAEWVHQPIGGATMIEVGRIFANLIDHRSAFTARHSACVAEVAPALASWVGMGRDDLQDITLAALLHDLGKLAVPSELLERPGPLSPEELPVLRQHPYQTWRILGRIRGFERIRRWAAQHHERVDGNGYPFRVDGRRLSMGSRVMAVADVFTALSEDRPYRRGMGAADSARVLRAMVADGGLCPEVTSVALRRIDDLLTTIRGAGYGPFSAPRPPPERRTGDEPKKELRT